MRPIRLTMQAFGSYGSKTEIDFTKPAQNLFLISGDTGSGKTTIFDAMVFAIYGEASSESNKKDGIELQSHFATTFVEPYVELEFTESEGGTENTYVVRRSPKHKKGNNKTEISATVSLTMPDGHEYTAVKETNAKLEEIVGLTKSQFMQVGMIAQGEFMQMLRADTKKKKPIFQKLFHTEIYENIVKELEGRKKAKEGEFGKLRTICQTEAAHIQTPEDYERAEELTGLIDKVRDAKAYNSVHMEALMEELNLLCQELETQKTILEEDAKQKTELYGEAVRATQAAKDLDRRYKDLDQAEQALRECAEEEESVKAKDNLSKQIQSAYEVKPYCKNWEEAETRLNDAIVNLKELEEVYPSLVSNSEAASKKSEEAVNTANEKRAAYTETETKVNAAREVFQHIQTEEKNKSSFEKALKRAEVERDEAKQGQKDLEIEEKNLKEALAKLEGVGADLAVWLGKLEKAKGFDSSLTSLRTQESDIQLQKELAEEKINDYAALHTQYDNLDEEYRMKNRIYLDDQAGFIAENYLRPGERCPVCGSLEHPEPRKLSDAHKEITRESLDKLEKKVSTLRGKVDTASKKAGEENSKLSEMKKTLNRDLNTLMESMAEEIPDVSFVKVIDETEEDYQLEFLIHYVSSIEAIEQLTRLGSSWMAEVQGNVSKLEAQNKKYLKIQKDLSSMDKKKAKMAEAVETADNNYQNASEKLKGSEAKLDTLMKSRTYETLTAAESEIKAAKAAKKTAEAAEKIADQEAKNASGALENAKTLIKKYQDEIPGMEDDAADKKNLYFKVMEDMDFSELEWKTLIETYRKTEIKTLQDAVNTHVKKKAAAEEKKKDAIKDINGKERPDLGALREKESIADAEAKDARLKSQSNSSYYSTNNTAFRNLNSKKEEREKIAKEYNTILTLYETLGGKKSGGHMDLETFVLRYYLERILHNANTRFLHMSGGQYKLIMVDLEDAGDGKNRGLDLLVYSTVTDKVRSIKTLSGGESFMAALALALGMADQIQANSSAVNLDVMFIDEGFGSLDDHSRNQAVRVLKEMAGGSKLIGIISHVSELKQEIDDQLLVRKTEEGSKVEWSNS